MLKRYYIYYIDLDHHLATGVEEIRTGSRLGWHSLKAGYRKG